MIDIVSRSNGVGQVISMTFAVVCGVLLLLIVGAQDLLLRLWGPCRLRGRRRGRRGRRGSHRGFLLGLRPIKTKKVGWRLGNLAGNFFFFTGNPTPSLISVSSL